MSRVVALEIAPVSSYYPISMSALPTKIRTEVAAAAAESKRDDDRPRWSISGWLAGMELHKALAPVILKAGNCDEDEELSFITASICRAADIAKLREVCGVRVCVLMSCSLLTNACVPHPLPTVS